MKRLILIALTSFLLWSCSDEQQASPSLIGHWVDVSNEKNTVTFNEDGSYNLDMALQLSNRANPWLPGESPLPDREVVTTLKGDYELTENKLWLKNPFSNNSTTGVPIGSFYGYSIDGIWDVSEDDNGDITIVPGKLKIDITWTIVSLTNNTLVIKTDQGKMVTYKKA